MATAQVRHRPSSLGVSWPWFREFIRWEIAPFPGRVNTVTRMTITATLVMIVIVTFRVPNAYLGALFSILLARENLTATWRGARMIVLGFVFASAYTLLGVMLSSGSPLTHFFWEIGSLYLVFFVMRTTTNYAAVLAFVIPVAIAMPIWGRSMPSELQVESTLWLVLIIAIGAGVTLGTEAVYRIFDNSDPLISSVEDLLIVVQQVVEYGAAHRAPPKQILDKLNQYHMIGTGRLRITLQRQDLNPAERARRSALIALAGRLIDLAANLSQIIRAPCEEDASRLRRLSARLEAIRTELCESGNISESLPVHEGPSNDFPVLQEMERVVALIPEVFQHDPLSSAAQDEQGRDWRRVLFLPDAFDNPEYRRFAFAGCLTAALCYLLYNALDWPGIGTTCVLTCIVTAQTTIGNSLQAQFLRLAGFVAGGVVLGLSAQILILPAIDSIFGFALLFAAVTAIGAWFATSSPRLSYFGVQLALSFYIINLQDSHIQTDLTIARDKAIGVLVGILAMGFIFDRFGTRSDAHQLQTLLVRVIKMLAQFAVCPLTANRADGGSQISHLRSQLNENFASLQSQTDTARFEFEFRRRREADVAECGRIQRAQPELRSIFLLEVSLLSHRGRLAIESKFNQRQSQALDRFLHDYSDGLTQVARCFAREEGHPARITEDSIRALLQNFEDESSPNSRAIADICQKMVSSLSMLQNECQLGFSSELTSR